LIVVNRAPGGDGVPPKYSPLKFFAGLTRVDMSTTIPPMARTAPSPQGTHQNRKIIGFSLPPALASKVKAEAGRRQISLKVLFEEMWAMYEKQAGKSKP
jgi:hypothetical protein